MRGLLTLTLVSFVIAGCATANQREARKQEMQAKVEELKRRRTVAMISEILKENVNSFQGCHQKQLTKKGLNNLSGDITLVFKLSSKGTLIRAGVGESSLPIDLRACLIEELWDIRFPATLTGRAIQIQQPLRF